MPLAYGCSPVWFRLIGFESHIWQDGIQGGNIQIRSFEELMAAKKQKPEAEVGAVRYALCVLCRASCDVRLAPCAVRYVSCPVRRALCAVRLVRLVHLVPCAVRYAPCAVCRVPCGAGAPCHITRDAWSSRNHIAITSQSHSNHIAIT